MKNGRMLPAGEKEKRKMVVLYKISQAHKDKSHVISALCGIGGKGHERSKRQKQRRMRKRDRGGYDRSTSWVYAVHDEMLPSCIALKKNVLNEQMSALSWESSPYKPLHSAGPYKRAQLSQVRRYDWQLIAASKGSQCESPARQP